MSGFVDFPQRMVIDEIQRAPELLRAIKSQVDADPRPGRFLLTGSSRLLALRALPDTLPGRMETIELWPFSQGEIDDRPDGFIDAIFADGPGFRHTSELTRADYANRLIRGGYPTGPCTPRRSPSSTRAWRPTSSASTPTASCGPVARSGRCWRASS